MTKRKILFYSLAPSDTTSFWRMHGTLKYINHPDLELVDASYTVNWNWSSMLGVDALILQRPFQKQHFDLIALAKDMGVYVICDYDDNLLEVDQYNPTYAMYASAKQTAIDCIMMADEIWVSTAALGEAYKHPNTYLIPNAWNDCLFPVEGKRKCVDNRKALWRGGSSHRADVAESATLLTDRMRENKDWTFLIAGDRFESIELQTGDNHHIIPYMSLVQFFRYMIKENPCVGFFPLRDTPFNRCKSNISWMEYTYAGAATYGNTELPEFSPEFVLPLEFLLQSSHEVHEDYNCRSWQYICDSLLLSDINKLRIGRLLDKG